MIRGIKSKIIKNENVENLTHLEITKLVLVHCNIFNDDYIQDSESLCTFGQLLHISLKNVFFKKSLIQGFHLLKCGY